ncbi:glycoside hydrolase family 3 N-terminal domain-containing protein [Gemmiger formicilis]
MPVINWILNQQIQLGMILCACLFVPWGQRRSCFVPRLAAGVWVFLALTDTLAFLPLWARLLLYTTLLFGLIGFSFDCSPLHALFYTTCAYAVQHIASKLAYMPIIWLIQHGRTDRRVTFVILLFSNLVVCLVIYLLFTLRIRRGRLLFDNVKTVLYSGFFLIAAVYLSVVLEDVLDSSAESYLTAYLALNAFCILFAITILALEFSNCSIKSLEHENETLAQLLECDKQQYEQAKKDMEKINIRYHDLKQQYSRATDEERARLEEEMDNLNLRYLTGNKALDITLTQKSALCGQAGIQLVCSADGSCLEDMKHYHIYSLLGNALDNAIECLTQVNDASKRVITLDISRCRDMAVIRVQNYTPAPPTLRDGAIVTTKQDTEEHGYGIKSIKSIAELYGEDALYASIPIAYAPGADTLRSPYSGRTSEYFSEDGVLSYYAAKAVSHGMRNKGLIGTVKHFFLNEQEAGRQGISTFANEQAIREIYMRAFEGSLAEGDSLGVMTAYNRIGVMYAAANQGIQHILRDEWNYGGYIIDDALTASEYSSAPEMLMAGNNIFCLDTARPNEIEKLITSTDDGDLLQKVIDSNHYLYYIMLQSSMGGSGAEDVVVSDAAPWWQTTLRALDVVFCALAVAAVVMYVLHTYTDVFSEEKRKNRAAKKN